MESQEVNFFQFEQPNVGFEGHSLNNNKTNTLINLSYSLCICCVATEGNIGIRVMSQTQLPMLSWEWSIGFCLMFPISLFAASFCSSFLSLLLQLVACGYWLLWLCSHYVDLLPQFCHTSKFSQFTFGSNPWGSDFSLQANALDFKAVKNRYFSVVPGVMRCIAQLEFLSF